MCNFTLSLLKILIYEKQAVENAICVLNFPFFKFEITFTKNLMKKPPFLWHILTSYEVLQRN